MKEPIKILLVEDNKIFVELLCEYLQKNKLFCIAGVAYNGEDACRIIDECTFDLVLLDIIMPDINGMEVLRHISKITPKPPKVIIITAIGHDDIISKAFRMGVDYCIKKPVEFELLESIIVSLFNLKRRRI